MQPPQAAGQATKSPSRTCQLHLSHTLLLFFSLNLSPPVLSHGWFSSQADGGGVSPQAHILPRLQSLGLPGGVTERSGGFWTALEASSPEDRPLRCVGWYHAWKAMSWHLEGRALSLTANPSVRRGYEAQAGRPAELRPIRPATQAVSSTFPNKLRMFERRGWAGGRGQIWELVAGSVVKSSPEARLPDWTPC